MLERYDSMEITWRDRLEWILLVGPLKTQENSNWNRYVNIYFLSTIQFLFVKN